MKKSIFAAVWLMISPALAQDVALLAEVGDYRYSSDIPSTSRLSQVRDPLKSSGFALIHAREMTTRDIGTLLEQLNIQTTGKGRVLAVLRGQFVHSENQTWLLSREARNPGFADLTRVGLSVESVLDVLSRVPGGAMLVLADGSSKVSLKRGLQAGVGNLEAPQGITIVQGPANSAVRFVLNKATQKGVSTKQMIETSQNVRASGFLSDLVSFRPAPQNQLIAKEAPSIDPNEEKLWKLAETTRTAEAFSRYIRKYPNGRYEMEAREALGLLNDPLKQAEAVEKNLNLSRDARRRIQRNLSILGYDTRGIDGIFGRGSRAAIAKWQSDNRYESNGYVTRPQLTILTQQAERKAEELEREAEARRLELEQRDREYWNSTGRLGDEAGLRAYLERYPDGVFAEIAALRLQPFEDAARAEAEYQDRLDWDQAESLDTLEAYQRYLQLNPEGAFAEQAKARAEELQFAAQNAEALQVAERNEARLGLNPGARRLVEDRLNRLKLKPGKVDGVFDDDTRRAIRRYQEARRINNTGYLDQATMVRLLADSVFK